MDELTDKLIEAKKQNNWELWHWEEALEENRSPKMGNLADDQKTKKIYKDVIMRGKKSTAKGVLLENATNPRKMVNGRLKYFTSLNNVYKYDWIFPLTRVECEGVEVSAPNNIDAVIGQKFGNVHDLPPLLDLHSLSLRFCDIGDARELSEMNMKKVYKELKKKSAKKIC